MQNIQDALMQTFNHKTQGGVIYEIYAKRASTDGYDYIGDIFMELSATERLFAVSIFERLRGMGVTDAPYSGSLSLYLSDTMKNLAHAIKRCESQITDTLPKFHEAATTANQSETASLIKLISDNEGSNFRFLKELHARLLTNKVYKAEHASPFTCEKCGHTQLSIDN